jgi:stage III sporulation protein AG
LQAKGRFWILLGGALAGILLILLGGTLDNTQEEIAQAPQNESLTELQAYSDALEKEVASLCDAVRGVSQVEVLLRLESGTRTVYATDENGKPSTVGSGSSQNALHATHLPPQIAGVGIVCRGGEDPRVQKKLTELISTALGISANRVFITGK